ncbi:hypothetical protein D9M73_290650 [compost metagenome]
MSPETKMTFFSRCERMNSSNRNRCPGKPAQASFPSCLASGKNITLVITSLTRAGLLISHWHKACSCSRSSMRRSSADKLRRVRLSVTNHSISPSAN